MGKRDSYTMLVEHPHVEDVRAVLAAVPHLGDRALHGLAGRWRNTALTSAGRARALSPDTVLVVEVLRAYGELQVMFAEDLAGGPASSSSLEPGDVKVALRAVRDTIAGVVARPVLRRGEYAALTAPWRAEVGYGHRAAGPGHAVEALRTLDRGAGLLAARCHTQAAARAVDALVLRAMLLDDEDQDQARARAQAAAATAGRHRVFVALRAQADQMLGRVRCPRCGLVEQDPADAERVAALVADAACALLVSDVLDRGSAAVLLSPVRGLIALPAAPPHSATGA